MGNCSCNCQQKAEKEEAPEHEKKIYICFQCHTFKATSSSGPAPECCGQKMQVLD